MALTGAIRGFWDELTDRFVERHTSDLDELEEGVERQIDSELKNLSEERLDSLIATIRARRNLVSTGAAYSNEIVAISKQILSFGAAGIGLSAAFARDIASLPQPLLKLASVATLFYFNLIVLSLFTLFGFLWQARFRYPFLYFDRIGNARPFFYYRAISPETPRSIFQTEAEKLLGARLYARDLIAFVQYLVTGTESTAAGQKPPDKTEVERKRTIAGDELKQYFLILSYQGYVNQYEVRMNNQFLYGLIASIVATASLAVYTFSTG